MEYDCVIKNGAIIRRSRNLRGMLDYARTSLVAAVETMRDPANNTRGILAVTYADGATCRASFASFNIMIDFVRNRRTWRGAKITHKDGNEGYLTIPGVIAGTIKTVRDSHIRGALDTLNTAKGLAYLNIGYAYYADIKGDGRNKRHVYVITNAQGGVSFSEMNGATMRKTLDLINAQIARVKNA